MIDRIQSHGLAFVFVVCERAQEWFSTCLVFAPSSYVSTPILSRTSDMLVVSTASCWPDSVALCTACRCYCCYCCHWHHNAHHPSYELVSLLVTRCRHHHDHSDCHQYHYICRHNSIIIIVFVVMIPSSLSNCYFGHHHQEKRLTFFSRLLQIQNGSQGDRTVHGRGGGHHARSGDPVHFSSFQHCRRCSKDGGKFRRGGQIAHVGTRV